MEWTADNLRDKQISVFGLRGTGKSVWTKWFIRKFNRPIVFDPLDEYKDFTRYVPTAREPGEEMQAEFDAFFRSIRGKKISCLAIDEANRIMPNREKPSVSCRDIIDLGRHDKRCYVFIARRPTQITTDAVELTDRIVFFRLDGKNDIKYIEDIKEGMGEAVRQLKPFHYLIYDRSDGSYLVHSPVKL